MARVAKEKEVGSEIQPIMLTVEDVAKLLSVCAQSVWRWSKEGRIPSPISLGSLKRWSRDTLVQWVADGCKPLNTEKSE